MKKSLNQLFDTFKKTWKNILDNANESWRKIKQDITSKFIDDIALDLGFDKLELSDELIQRALNPAENVKIRAIPGGPAPEMVELARDNIKDFLNIEFEKHGI